jgi:hypothetical protein
VTRSIWMVHVVYIRGRAEFQNEDIMFGLRDGCAPRSGKGSGILSPAGAPHRAALEAVAQMDYPNANGTGGVDTAVNRESLSWNIVFTARAVQLAFTL